MHSGLLSKSSITMEDMHKPFSKQLNFHRGIKLPDLNHLLIKKISTNYNYLLNISKTNTCIIVTSKNRSAIKYSIPLLQIVISSFGIN